jgi:hypothetical protein
MYDLQKADWIFTKVLDLQRFDLQSAANRTRLL